MYQRIAAATVIRGKGACVAYVNGVASADIQNKQAQMIAETERAKVVEASRGRLLARQAAELVRRLEYTPGPLGRMWRRFTDAYALTVGTVIAWGEKLGLWFYEIGGENGDPA